MGQGVLESVCTHETSQLSQRYHPQRAQNKSLKHLSIMLRLEGPTHTQTKQHKRRQQQPTTEATPTTATTPTTTNNNNQQQHQQQQQQQQ